MARALDFDSEGREFDFHVAKQYNLVPVKRQGAVVSCGWEGNRRSGVALAMSRRLQWFIYLRAHGLRKGDEHPAYTPHEAWHTLGPPNFTLPACKGNAIDRLRPSVSTPSL